ncbi:MAG: Eco47II family restriction endonuclease [Methanobrevibacter sp. CfCl-M3]
MYTYLDFIKDDDFKKSVNHVLKGYSIKTRNQNIIDLLKEYDNTIDEFKLLFDLYGNRTTLKSWKEAEILRQNDKTVNNYIGEFHQMVLGSVRGWTDLGIGDKSEIDLKKNDNSIFVELKNKFNTMNSSSEKECRRKLEKIVQEYPNSTAYWAFIISKDHKSVNTVWTSKNYKTDHRILKVSGNEIYKIVTGDSNALNKTFKALNLVLNDIVSEYSLSNEDQRILSDFSNNIFLGNP